VARGEASQLKESCGDMGLVVLCYGGGENDFGGGGGHGPPRVNVGLPLLDWKPRRSKYMLNH
jgi:hypothetical protein